MSRNQLPFNLQGMDEETLMKIVMQMSMEQTSGGSGGQGGFGGGFGFRPRDPRDVGAVGMESVLKREHKDPTTNITIQVRKGDMTKEKVDVIVNAANKVLDHASGLAGAIVKNGGKEIQQESDQLFISNGQKPFPEGSVQVTGAGKLPCKHVFHAIGPIWSSMKPTNTKIGTEQEDAELALCVTNSLELATKKNLQSISLPAISSGIFGFPKDRCAIILFNAVQDYLQKNPTSSVKEIRFTNFDDKTVDIIVDEFDKRFKKGSSSSN